jgi:hypothetical protein
VNPISQRTAQTYPQESFGCWQQIRNDFCRVAGIITRAGGWLLDTISGLFFSVLRVVWPTSADKIEALWGRVTTIYERVKGAIREGRLKEDIQKLETDGQILGKKVNSLAIRIEKFGIENDHLGHESDLLQEERDRARRERDDSIDGRSYLIGEWDRLRTDNQQLGQRLHEAVRAQDAAIEAKNRQQTEHAQALQEVVVIRHQLEQRNRQDALLAELQRIHEIYTQNKLTREEGGQPPMSELELERLIPQYERQKGGYQRMIQETLNDLSPDHELQVPLQGILNILNEEVGHLQRISEAMLFYSDLEDPLARILEALNQAAK